jgi:hypothetical protein
MPWERFPIVFCVMLRGSVILSWSTDRKPSVSRVQVCFKLLELGVAMKWRFGLVGVRRQGAGERRRSP